MNGYGLLQWVDEDGQGEKYDRGIYRKNKHFKQDIFEDEKGENEVAANPPDELRAALNAMDEVEFRIRVQFAKKGQPTKGQVRVLVEGGTP